MNQLFVYCLSFDSINSYSYIIFKPDLWFTSGLNLCKSLGSFLGGKSGRAVDER